MFKYLFLLILISCGVSAPKVTAVATENQKVEPTKFTTVKVKAIYPHDSMAYTQGLLFYKGKLYESTGGYGTSSIRRVDLMTGKVEKIENLESQYFGEGLTVVNDQLVQLTWQEGRAFTYDVNTFKRMATNNIRGEGWGVVYNNGELYVSDGSNMIMVLDPKSYKVKRTIGVFSDKGALMNINEMEWIDGRIWANVYTTPLVAVINPMSGVVEMFIDCTPLFGQVKNREAEVLNGIAYDSISDRLVVTGKNWDKLFEIEL